MGRRRPQGGDPPAGEDGRGAPGDGRLSAAPKQRPPLRAVLFDLDGTLTSPRSSWQYVHERLGLWNDRAERFQESFRTGRITYEEFCRLDAEEWRGTMALRLLEICDAIPYHDGAADLTAELRRAGVIVGIVSTGLSLLAERVRRELRLDHAISNEIVVRDGVVTGDVVIRVPHGGKDAALADFCRAFDLDPGEVAAVGDTEGDVSMFRAAGWSVAFNATDPAVHHAASAVALGGDLRVLVDCLLPRGG